MRVLRPLFHNSDNEETTAEAEALPATVEAPWNEEAPPQPEFNATQDSHRQKAFPTEHHPAEDDRKQPALPRKNKPSSPKRQFRNEEHSSKVSPKKKARAIPAKKPPPQPPTPVTTTTETTSDQESQLIMTAPKFLDEERQQEEVLENEPPEAARPAVASRNVHSDQADLDPALVSVAPQHDTFVQALKKKGLEIVEQDGDGNCLFRAISLQVYGDASMHGEVRARCMDFMALNEEHFGQFVTGETYTEYIARKRLDGVHGNNPEIQAMSEIYNRPVEVYTPDRGDEPLNIFHKEYSTADIPIRLSYHDGNHYNAVIDPIRPTAGLGLGLPGLQPGLADKKQMATAVMESDQQNDLEKAIQESQQDLDQTFDDDLQRAIKESSQSVSYMYQQKALALSDADATALAMEQSAMESSLQSYIQTELSRKKRASPEDSPDRSRQQNSSPALPTFAPLSVAAAAAAAPPVAAAAASSAGHEDVGPPDEYPPVVQELVMNGFELPKVVRAYDLIGDNFDNLLSFLCSSTGGYS